MIFTSELFLFWFLPAVLALYALTPMRARSLLLTVASYVFYGAWRLDFVALMMASTLLDYGCGRVIGGLGERLAALPEEDPGRAALVQRRKLALLTSITANLGLLGYFKYWNFGAESLGSLLALVGVESLGTAEIVLPVGISFYTFQSLSYSVDVYRGDAPAVRRFIDFSCYIALFPQLVAGPIVRYRTLAEQLVHRTHTWEKVTRGAFLFQVGFAKKILLADPFGVIADEAFGAASLGMGDAWLGTLAYTLQIYFDFSGYSDMAIGLGAFFGFTFPINFDSPYKSTSITEFWRRWHVSLSSWLRDYLYVPLGGNRRGKVRTYVNLMLTMLLGGLWHGAAMTFVLWGAYQGAWLALERMLGKKPPYAGLPRAARVALTFVLAMGGWVLFRAETGGHALAHFAAMAGSGGESLGLIAGLDPRQWTTLAAALIIVFLCPSSQELERSRTGLPHLFGALAFALAVCQLFVVEHSPFLYFQF